MRGMNRVVLLGRVGAPLSQRRTRSGVMILELRLATRRSDRGRDEVTDWHQVRLWGTQAEQCSAILQPGDPLAVEGQLRMESWIDSEGTTHQRAFIYGERAHLIAEPAGGGAQSG